MRFYFDIRDKLAIRDEVGRDLSRFRKPLCTQNILQPTFVAWNPMPGLDCPLRSLAKAISESMRKLFSLKHPVRSMPQARSQI